MKIIYSKPYAYLIVENGSDWYLTFFTGGPVEIDICVKLNEQEKNDIEKSDSSISLLIEKFRKDKDSYNGRRVIPSVVPNK